MSFVRLMLLTLITMLCFAGNSVFCRLALRQTSMMAASFTSVRLMSGALVLALLCRGGNDFGGQGPPDLQDLGGSWISALALFVYASACRFFVRRHVNRHRCLAAVWCCAGNDDSDGLWRGERLNAQQNRWNW